MIVGTAGHIDQGKTALVRALTGIDTDRLPGEKGARYHDRSGLAEIAPVSVITGMASRHLNRGFSKRLGLFRYACLAVDRCFSLPGTGTIVAGTILRR
jgi:selenocysteine-specific translation elongation factor